MKESEKSSPSSSPVTRRDFLKYSAMGAALPVLGSVSPSVLNASSVQPSNGARRPNILWICTDQQRFDTIRALGNHNIRTPNLDRLAASGVAFANTYCQAPICTPSRASFLTGLYPCTEHVLRNGNEYFPERFIPRLVPHWLAAAGYDCGLAGKLHLSSCRNRPEPNIEKYGYRVVRWSHAPAPRKAWEGHEAYQEWLHEQGVDWNKEFGAHKLPDWPPECNASLSAKYSHATWCADAAIPIFSTKLSSPWFMSVNMFSPHPLLRAKTPEQMKHALERKKLSYEMPSYCAPPEYLKRMDPEKMPLPEFRPSDLETFRLLRGVDHQTSTPQNPADYPARYMVAAYYASVELVDTQVGRLLDALEATGQRDNTIVLFTSDHGEMLGDHGLTGKGCRFYEGAVHVPLIVSWPGHFRSGVVSKALVELMDIAPTLMDATGTPEPNDMFRMVAKGQSLYPLLTGKTALNQHRSFVRSSYHDTQPRPNATHGNMIFDGRWKLTAYQPGDWIIDGKPELAKPVSREGELYDLTEDPHEFRNRWVDPSAQEVKNNLMFQLFDSLQLATDPGQPRIASF